MFVLLYCGCLYVCYYALSIPMNIICILVMPVRVLDWKIKHSILFYSFLVYEQRSLISAFVFLNLNNIMDIQVQILMSKV